MQCYIRINFNFNVSTFFKKPGEISQKNVRLFESDDILNTIWNQKSSSILIY